MPRCPFTRRNLLSARSSPPRTTAAACRRHASGSPGRSPAEPPTTPTRSGWSSRASAATAPAAPNRSTVSVSSRSAPGVPRDPRATGSDDCQELPGLSAPEGMGSACGSGVGSRSLASRGFLRSRGTHMSSLMTGREEPRLLTFQLQSGHPPESAWPRYFTGRSNRRACSEQPQPFAAKIRSG